ncbi:MAG TPA: hypothetical protein VFZ53_11235 [Polyangiaceae bacterium]
MERLVVFGAWCLLAGFAACGNSGKSSQRGDDDDGAAGEAPGGQGSGGEPMGGSGGDAAGSGSGRGGLSGSGGRSMAGSGFGALGGGAGFQTGGAGGRGGRASVPCGAVDCLQLPNVRPDAHPVCENSRCILTPEDCEEGYAHCSAFWLDGCEADLRATNTCGSCDTHCYGSTPACTLGPNGLHCSTGCDGLTPDRCRSSCTNFETDDNNCGACENDCTTHTNGECVDGECRRIGPCDSGYGDCTEAAGCETALTTPQNCGACGRDDCGAANAVAECSSASGCVPPRCAAGFANCDRTSVDCEANGTACFPDALASIELPMAPVAMRLIDGGALFTAGHFGNEFDFDASAGSDVRSSAGYFDAYVTRYDANGAYAWTRTFGGSLDDFITAAGVARDGTLLVAGNFLGTADLDPGSGVDQHLADTSGSGFVSKLTAAGVLVWARDLRGQAKVERLAGDAAGAVYASGTFDGTIDLDPGPATSLHTAAASSGAFLVKFDASGNFVWDRIISGNGERLFTGLAVAADSSVWVAGRHTEAASLGSRSLDEERGMFVAGFEPSGTERTFWLPGVAASYSNTPTVSAGENVYVEGHFTASFDVDPGSESNVRLSLSPGYGSGFSVGLGKDGAYRNAHVFAVEPLGIHEIPGGGSLIVMPNILPQESNPHLVAYYSDGTPAWTLPFGAEYYTEVVVSNTHFAVLGAADVGPTLSDYTFTVHRYAF